MKKLLKISVLSIFLGVSNNANAQQIQTTTESFNNTELTITMDKRIGELLNKLEDGCIKTSSHNSKTTNANSSNTDTNKKLSNTEICKQNPRILGYKIQVAVVKNKEEADKIRANFRKKFPNIKVEIDASLRPNYKILVGSYFTKESSNPDLKRIRAAFGSATAIQYRIFCAEAK